MNPVVVGKDPSAIVNPGDSLKATQEGISASTATTNQSTPPPADPNQPNQTGQPEQAGKTPQSNKPQPAAGEREQKRADGSLVLLLDGESLRLGPDTGAFDLSKPEVIALRVQAEIAAATQRAEREQREAILRELRRLEFNPVGENRIEPPLLERMQQDSERRTSKLLQIEQRIQELWGQLEDASAPALKNEIKVRLDELQDVLDGSVKEQQAARKQLEGLMLAAKSSDDALQLSSEKPAQERGNIITPDFSRVWLEEFSLAA
jgi:hypothetical protein